MAGFLASSAYAYSTGPVLGDLTWTTPGRSSADSMPLGNGDIAANVWTDPDGDILCYLAKNDAWDHLGRLIKVGRIRISLKPDLLDRGNFEQSLSLEDASIVISNGSTTIKLWCDAHWPRLVVEVESDEPCEVRVKLDKWRPKARELDERELYSQGQDGPYMAMPDNLVRKQRGAVAWYQRNESSIWSSVLDLQGLAESETSDPLINRTFGGYIKGEGFKNRGRDGLSIRKVTTASFSVTVHCAQTESVESWLEQIKNRAGSITPAVVADAWRDHQTWWSTFWERSHIQIESRGDDRGHTEKISQQLAWHRFMVACAGRGEFPVKFNGGLFTADWPIEGETFDADYRRWGGGYWWQNTRLIYWSLLGRGDYEMLRPLFRMYLEMLPLAEYRTQKWFDHGGVFFPETQYFWGTHLPNNYGWDRKGRELKDVENNYIRHEWVSGLELIALLLETYKHTQDDALLKNELLPIARAVLKFYALHYPHDSSGRLKIHPSQALETWWDTTNPMPEIAGLHYLLPRLLSLPDGALTVSDLGAWRALSARLPRLPIGKRNGKLTLLVAAEHEGEPHNMENPELYAIFPFKLFGVGRPDFELAHTTYDQRLFVETGGWHQDSIQAAMLGRAEQAAYYVGKNYTQGHHPEIRFPGFWGPNYDWVPDFDHGSVGQIAIQSMLVQTVGSRIYLFPAWPSDRWNVSFRLHLPEQTVVDCKLEEGKITHLEVTPTQRKQQIVVLLDQDKAKAADIPFTYPG